LYDLNLATGGISNGALVGPAAAPFDFVGGFSVLPVEIPEPAGVALFVCAAIAVLGGFRRRNS
jgi:hypothetical protein